MLLFSRGDNMSASKQIKQAMLEKNIKVSDLAEKIGMKPQPLSTKLYRDTMSYSDVEKIADALGCDQDRRSGDWKNILIFQTTKKEDALLSSSFYIYCLFYFSFSFPYFQDICSSLFCATQSERYKFINV